ncbi:guanylate kinase-associated family member mars [Cochliomyia hominivorax]
MDHHKILYKDSRSQTPRQYNRLNRELQVANRCKQRRDRFQDSRNISPSPTPNKKEIIIPLGSTENKENHNSTRLAKIVCDTKNPEKLTKQEAFLKRFVEYMDKKKEIKKQKLDESNKKKPFVSTVGSGRQLSVITSTANSLVPKGHPEGFKPPAGLKNPLEEKKIVKGRQSIYTVVPTPPKKTVQPLTKQLATNKFITKPLLENKKPSTIKKTPVNSAVGKIVTSNLVTTFERPKPTAAAATAPGLARNHLKPRVLKMPPPPPAAKKPPEIKQTKFPTKKSLEIKKPEPDTSLATKQSGVAAKIRTLAAKRAENVKPNRKSPIKSCRAGLAQSLKAKKPMNNSKRINVPPSLQINGKQLLNLVDVNKPSADDMVIQTPKDYNSLNAFEPFVTSTRLRNSSQIVEEQLEGTTPKEVANNRKLNNSSAKRNIMVGGSSENSTENELKKDVENIVNKYNFVRYSEAPNVTINDDIDNVPKSEEEKKENDNHFSDEENRTLVHTSIVEEKTPIKSGPEERPANYLSPFVSVARGKVSLKKEKEKRNSVYLQNPTENEVSSKLNHSPKYSVEVRRTLEAVSYFRKQLQDEIDRLHALCDVWEAYKSEHFEKIQNANGEDMINVSVGQTRLLTSKKFMQFKGLIDRCEAGATGIGAVEYDGSEDTKPITSEDLEGFWSMLGIQVDNLDKRFANLERWKQNDWQDPDEVKPKIKKNLTKVVKKTKPAAKAKPNTALQQMLRKMQAEMRKNKNNQEDNDIVLTPSKQKPRRSSINNSTTPRKSMDNSSKRRLSIVVKDRKYFSPAATVISVASPNRRTSMQLQRKSSQDSPKVLNHIQKFNEVLDNIESSHDLRKSVLINGNTRRMSLNPTPSKAVSNSFNDEATKSPTQSPKPVGRKSILKTPGTAKSRLRNVIFNEKLRVKKFNFLINDGDHEGIDGEENGNDTHEEDLAKNCEAEPQSTDSPKRTITLRNRKVRLRPSCEIVIPK